MALRNMINGQGSDGSTTGLNDLSGIFQPL